MQHSPGDQRVLDLDGFERLLVSLRDDGFRLVGPTARDGAIQLDEIGGHRGSAARCRRRTEPRSISTAISRRRRVVRLGRAVAAMEEAVPASAPRPGPHPAQRIVARSRQRDAGCTSCRHNRGTPLAKWRRCECKIECFATDHMPMATTLRGAQRRSFSPSTVGLHLERVFASRWKQARERRPDSILPRRSSWSPNHRFVMEVGTDAGARLLERVEVDCCNRRRHLRQLKAVVADAAKNMGRALDTKGLPERLLANLEHPRWDGVAERCLGCGNCTLACPTCFCTTVEDASDLAGDVATRTRTWDSCFAPDFAYIHGGSVRPTLRARVSAMAHPQAGYLGRTVRNLRDASAVVGASLGVPSGSTSRSKQPRWEKIGARDGGLGVDPYESIRSWRTSNQST